MAKWLNIECQIGEARGREVLKNEIAVYRDEDRRDEAGSGVWF